tara:strand:+ start:138 stop:1181 length:1044 start_codon:yes stop_codon:yes gene_type:complete
MNLKKIAIAVVMLSLVCIACFSYYIYSIMLVPNTAFNSIEAFVFIRSGASYSEVRSDLEPLLLDIEKFDLLAQQKKYTKNVKPGRYRISKGMTNNDIINSLRSQNLTVIVAFNNQQNLEVLAQRVSSQIEADSLSLITAFKDSVFLRSNGFTSETALAMYLPNSYDFFWNTTAIKFRSKLQKEYNRFWDSKRKSKAKDLGLSPIQVSILAAIVQEESKQIQEQPRIAGVYINRLKNNWALQADPTLKFAAYQIKAYKNTVIKRLLNKHKKINSPYNTYKNTGLPPGLIAMPDLSTIDAVLNCEKHSYFYFAADPDKPGFHRFAKTLSLHKNNARRYHNYLNNQGIRK